MKKSYLCGCMLYSKEYISESSLVGVWKVEESRDELLSALSHHESVSNVNTIKSETRVLEVLAVRVLLKELLGEEKHICYNSTGKPFLADKSYNISISHTKKYVAIALNKENPLGLDLECISEKIRRVQSRLVSNEESIDKDNEIVHLLLHWSAKEAMFKYIDEEGVDFLKHLFVHPFTPAKKGLFQASESRTENAYRFDAYYKVDQEFVIVCLEAKNDAPKH